MSEQQGNHISLNVVAAITVAVMTTGCGVAWWTLNSTPNSQIAPPAKTTNQPTQASPSVQPRAEQTANIYWLKDTGKQTEVVATPVTLAAAKATINQPDAILAAAFERLLQGPPDAAYSSTIPKLTKLRGVKVEKDGIHVDLSQEFTTGGGSASMTGRVAQVLYTATTLQPNAKVWIAVEGKPLDVLGGEGLELNQPLTRQSFRQNFAL